MHYTALTVFIPELAEYIDAASMDYIRHRAVWQAKKEVGTNQVDVISFSLENKNKHGEVVEYVRPGYRIKRNDEYVPKSYQRKAFSHCYYQSAHCHVKLYVSQELMERLWFSINVKKL